METVENLEGHQSQTVLGSATKWRMVNGSEELSKDEGPPEGQNSQVELDRDQKNGVDISCKISSDISEEAEQKLVAPGEDHPKSPAQPCNTDNAAAEKPEAEPPSAAPSSEQEVQHHSLPRIVKHKPGSITFWDCSVTPAAGSEPFVNDSSDECSAGEEKQDDDPDCGDDDGSDVFEELPRGRQPPVSQRARDRQRRRGTSSAGRSCGYEAEGESSSKEVMLPFGIFVFDDCKILNLMILLLNS